MMNVNFILRLADLIEKQEFIYIKPDEDPQRVKNEERSGFNMSVYVHPCGTPACIAGYMCMLNYADGTEEDVSKIKLTDVIPEGNRNSSGEYDYHGAATEILGLDYETAMELFIPSAFSSNKITPTVAAKTLRNLVATGEVVFEIE